MLGAQTRPFAIAQGDTNLICILALVNGNVKADLRVFAHRVLRKKNSEIFSLECPAKCSEASLWINSGTLTCIGVRRKCRCSSE